MLSDGVACHAEGYGATASGFASHAEGGSTASGWKAHAEGASNATGNGSHAEGSGISRGQDSHAEGGISTASGWNSHAEGYCTTASNNNAHSEGNLTEASGKDSHAEGHGSKAIGDGSHAQGFWTTASKNSQTTLGSFNVIDSATTTIHPSGYNNYGKYAVIVGNGTGTNARSNALAVRWDGSTDLYSSNLTNGTNPSAQTDGTGVVRLVDSTGATLREIVPRIEANGKVGLSIVATNAGGAENRLDLGIAQDGTKSVSVNDTAAWRSALELGTTAPGTILWSGTLYMTGGHTANLSHNISTCPSGILLHWQPYTSSTVQNWGHEFTFIPKTQHNGAGCMARLATSKFGVVGTKSFYVSDNKITGNNDNNASGTANGIKYTNGY